MNPSTHTFISFCAAQLLKTENCALISSSETENILALVGRLSTAMESEGVAVDKNSFSKLWSRFLKQLMAEHKSAAKDAASIFMQPADLGGQLMVVDDGTLATMEALNNPGFWENMMLPRYVTLVAADCRRDSLYRFIDSRGRSHPHLTRVILPLLETRIVSYQLSVARVGLIAGNSVDPFPHQPV